MINLGLALSGDSLKILCIGAHSDDIEIGAGGTIIKLVEVYQRIAFYWVVLSSDERRGIEARESAEALLTGVADKTVVIKDFKDGYFPYMGSQIKNYFEILKREVNPDLIFTHFRSDLHQDHRLVSELTWNTFRDHLILEYEIPKYDGDLGTPNVFIVLEEGICKKKIEHIKTYFISQVGNQWFSEETFKAVLNLRGTESNAPTRYAEAFHSRKIVLI